MTEFLDRPDGLRLAYQQREGEGPTIVFLPGYMSDMAGSKALFLDEWADTTGQAMLRIDYAGCGASDGAFVDQTIAGWRDDVLLAIDALVEGPVILVGSSMGGWLMLLAALAIPDRVAGLVGIAAAPDFTDWGFDDAARETLRSAGRIDMPSLYSDTPTPFHRGLWDSGQALLLLGQPIAIDCPVRLLHGQADADVPPDISVRLAAGLRSADVQTILVKDGDHRLSRPADLLLLRHTLEALLESL